MNYGMQGQGQMSLNEQNMSSLSSEMIETIQNQEKLAVLYHLNEVKRKRLQLEQGRRLVE